MEHWRVQEDAKNKRILLVLSSITLGGCGIWCTHFTGMNALNLVLKNGTILAVNFELGLTLLSFLLPTLGVWIGLRIASTDPFFLEMEATRRREMMVRQSQPSSLPIWFMHSLRSHVSFRPRRWST
jgi:NO-binding membrane sensor protein with MHYT domain